MNEPIAKIAAIGTTLRDIYGDLERAARDAGVRLTGPQAMILASLEDGQTPGDIERGTAYAGTNCTYNLQQLQERGLIRREPVPNDGRSSRLRRTALGRQIAERLGEAAAASVPQRAPDLAAVLS